MLTQRRKEFWRLPGDIMSTRQSHTLERVVCVAMQHFGKTKNPKLLQHTKFSRYCGDSPKRVNERSRGGWSTSGTDICPKSSVWLDTSAQKLLLYSHTLFLFHSTFCCLGYKHMHITFWKHCIDVEGAADWDELYQCHVSDGQFVVWTIAPPDWILWTFILLLLNSPTDWNSWPPTS